MRYQVHGVETVSHGYREEPQANPERLFSRCEKDDERPDEVELLLDRQTPQMACPSSELVAEPVIVLEIEPEPGLIAKRNDEVPWQVEENRHAEQNDERDVVQRQ